MTFSYIGKLKNQPINSVTASMVRTLALGLGIPEADVARAALGSMGVHITRDSAGLDVAITDEPSLTDYDKRLLRSVVKEMRNDGEERRDNGTGDHGGPDLPSAPQSDGATRRLSEPRLKLLTDDVPDLEGLPYAADAEEPGDDPGEDDD